MATFINSSSAQAHTPHAVTSYEIASPACLGNLNPKHLCSSCPGYLNTMAANRRRNLAASRRRIDEEGEDEETGVDNVDDSQSDASVLSYDQASADGSELSDAGDVTLRGKEEESSKSPRSSRKAKHRNVADVQKPVTQRVETQPGAFIATADMDALQNGFTSAGQIEGEESIAFENAAEDSGLSQEPVADTASVQGSTGKRESYVTRARREGPALKDKGPANPAFVPNRGGFFMHDYRNDSGNQPGLAKGRGRGSGPSGNMPANARYVDTSAGATYSAVAIVLIVSK